MTDGLILRLSTQGLRLSLFDWNIDAGVFAVLDNHILQRLAPGDGELAILLVLVELGEIWRCHSDPVGARAQAERIASVRPAMYLPGGAGHLVSDDDNHST